MEILALALLVSALVLALLLVALRRGPDPAALRAQEALTHSLRQLQSDLTRVSRTQDELRLELQRGRETSLKELAQAPRRASEPRSARRSERSRR
jgi:hypothetical protein